MGATQVGAAHSGPGLTPAAAISAWFRLAIASVLCVILPTLLLVQVHDAHRSPAWVLGIAIMVWSGLHLAQDLVRGTPRLFDFFLWLFTYIFFGIAATIQLRSDSVPWTTQGMAPRLDVPTMVVIMVGLACYEAGALVAESRNRLSVIPDPGAARVHPGRAVATLLASLPISAYFLLRVGVQKAVVSRDEADIMTEAAFPDPTTLAIVTAVATFPMLLSIGAVGDLVRRTTSIARRVSGLVLIAVAAGLQLAINSPLSSARYTFGTVGFALIVYSGFFTTRTRTRVLMAVTVFGFLFLFPLANAFRTAGGTHVRTSFFGEYPDNPDYDAFWMIGNAITYWHEGLATPMHQLLGCLFFWVPRSVWPNKALDTAVELAHYRGYGFTNLSAPLWAEAYVNGGFLFMVVVFLLAGWGLRLLDIRFERYFRRGGWWILPMGVFPVYLNILLRGSMLQATGSLAVSLFTCLWLRQWRGERVAHTPLR